MTCGDNRTVLCSGLLNQISIGGFDVWGYDNKIGQTVKVTIDRPLGSFHPEHPDMFFPINYGYVEGIIAPDGEEQDVYILGVDKPLREFTGRVIAVIHRLDDVEDKWVAAPEGVTFSKEEIIEQVRFQEQYFKSEIITE